MFSVDELEFLKLLLYGGGCLGCASFVTLTLLGLDLWLERAGVSVECALDCEFSMALLFILKSYSLRNLPRCGCYLDNLCSCRLPCSKPLSSSTRNRVGCSGIFCNCTLSFRCLLSRELIKSFKKVTLP